MADLQALAEFVRDRVPLGRVRPEAGYASAFYYPVPLAYSGVPLPSVAEVGEALFRHPEFRALQLGGLVNTPTGDFLEQAVELVVPRVIASEFGLIVAALKYAADRQQGESRGKALLAVGGTFLFGLLLREMG
jgi:hypothetical protein